MWATRSPGDIIGPKQVGFAKAVQKSAPFLSEQKDVHVAADAAQPDKVIGNTDGPGDLAGPDQSELAPAPGA